MLNLRSPAKTFRKTSHISQCWTLKNITNYHITSAVELLKYYILHLLWKDKTLPIILTIIMCYSQNATCLSSALNSWYS